MQSVLLVQMVKTTHGETKMLMFTIIAVIAVLLYINEREDSPNQHREDLKLAKEFYLKKRYYRG